MPHAVFISHASKDAAVAQRVLGVLETRGVRCWIAPRDIVAGREWEPSIIEALRSAKAVVLVFSGAADASAHVRREVAAAADAGVPVLPFRIDRAPMGPALSYYLHGVHWLDAADRPEARLEELADTVQALVDGAEPPRGGERLLSMGRRRNPWIALAAAALALPIVAGVWWLAENREPPATPPRQAAPRDTPRPAPVDPAEAAPEALVRRLYARGSGARGALNPMLTVELREADTRRLADAEGEEARRDWRYPPGDERPAFETLAIETRANSDRTATVSVRWGGFMRRREATYSLCRRADGRWRVTDVAVDGRRLREVNALPPPDPLGCA